MSKFFSKLPTQAVSLFALLLASLPVCGNAELTQEQLTDAFVDALKEYATFSSGNPEALQTMPVDYQFDYAISDYLYSGLFAKSNSLKKPYLGSIFDWLKAHSFTNDLGEVVNGLDVLTNQLAHVSQRTDWISEDASLIRDLLGENVVYLNATYHLGTSGPDGQNVWVMNPDDIGEEVGSAVGSTIGSELSLATSKLDEIISKLTPTNHVDISSEEVNYLDQDDFEDTSDALSESPYDDTSYSSPTNTDHFSGIGNPTLLDLPDPTSKLNDLSTSVQNLPQNDEIVFWDGESGTSADALGKVSVRLGEQGMVQTSGNVFVFAWNLLYAIFSGLAVWRFVLNVHPTQNQMQGKLF